MISSRRPWSFTPPRSRTPKTRNVARTGNDGPIASAEFVVGGQVFMGYNGGSYFTFSEGVSLYVDCEDQAEVDGYWDKVVKAGATPTACGWIKDPFGLSWQIVPRRFMEQIRDRNPGKVKAVMEANRWTQTRFRASEPTTYRVIGRGACSACITASLTNSTGAPRTFPSPASIASMSRP